MDLNVMIFQKMIFYLSLIKCVSLRFLNDEENYCARGVVHLLCFCKTFCDIFGAWIVRETLSCDRCVLSIRTTCQEISIQSIEAEGS